jgi:hypothetical protein
MSEPLGVVPAVLRSTGTTFGQTAEGLARLQAQGPLNDAAAAVSALQTAGACRAAATEVAAEIAAVQDAARGFSEKLEAAARAYEHCDQTAAGAIGNVEMPK